MRNAVFALGLISIAVCSMAALAEEPVPYQPRGGALSVVPPPNANVPDDERREFLSKRQIGLLKQIETFTIIRMEWRKSTEGRSLALSLGDHIRAAWQRHFPNFPYVKDGGMDNLSQAVRGRLVCRLLLRAQREPAALYLQCDLGNMAVRVIQSQELLVLRRQEVTQAAKDQIDQQVARLARLFWQAR